MDQNGEGLVPSGVARCLILRLQRFTTGCQTLDARGVFGLEAGFRRLDLGSSCGLGWQAPAPVGFVLVDNHEVHVAVSVPGRVGAGVLMGIPVGSQKVDGTKLEGIVMP